MKHVFVAAGLMALSACAVPMTQTTQDGFMKEVPENIVALAGPNQDLTAVQLNPEDGCFWYRHVGPVETTMLPLRTAAGNPICAQAQEPLETAM